MSSFDTHTGARIRQHRKLARLTQRELAARIPYSYSLLNQVECGARAASTDLVAAVAAALRIDVSVLTGRAVTDSRLERRAALVGPIREALDLYDMAPDAVRPSRPVTVLAGEADQVCRQVRATHLRTAAGALPDLITDLTHVVLTAPSTDAWRALASAYRTAHDISLKWAYRDLAALALDRMGWAAGHAADPCLVAIRHYKRALSHQDSPLGSRLIRAGHEVLEGRFSREALAVAGQLHLGASVVAARADDPSGVARHIEAARELAARVGGEAREIHWLSFGHLNVALHDMGAAITMRRYDDALRQARWLRLPPSTLTSRRARFLVDRALVEMETGLGEASLRHLAEARRVAPEQTRYHPRTHRTVRGLLHTTRRPTEELVRMASWAGV
ncbi:helix-turn-helix domain-containing protein [Streptomyces abyssomicinicus]|uniref:helix-turn-helix domain-containing protein n=1 Tax=Streptomyces abyssomicinicus TaxID=574929 RepID=UPI00124F77FD|nr:helix-turn-helix transcriptional regulator [Streptomyces abyssomicinicus]